MTGYRRFVHDWCEVFVVVCGETALKCTDGIDYRFRLVCGKVKREWWVWGARERELWHRLEVYLMYTIPE